MSGSYDGTVRVWDLATGAAIGVSVINLFAPLTARVRAVAAADLENRPVVITGSSDGTLRVWDLGTGQPVGGLFTGHTATVRAVTAAELKGRPVIISGSEDRTVRVWDLAARRAMRHHFRRVRLR